ncbi:unnamed protein product [Brassicogethes aeneus]|uniref:Uncharacterized protein n=1 Tax=Brassicogethes aeneus TaxID=1431903 RepID=A0A9P0B8Z1_BRAAE|nr:unnamed protein product [Brassicogethes aeneus]
MEPKHYRLKWNNFQKNLLNEFESMQSSEELADVTLTCEGINLKAHKFILSACSPYFRTVFKENPCPHPIVILKDIFYVDLIAIINYMYHGEVMVSEDNLSTFLETAVILQVSGLATTKKFPTIKNKHRKEKAQHFNPMDQSKRIKKSDPPIRMAGDAFSLSKDSDVEIKLEKTDNLLLQSSEETMLDNSNDNGNMEKVEKNDPPASILEAALEFRDKPSGSILERSLMSNQTDKIPTFPVSQEIFIPRKPPEMDHEMHLLQSESSESSSPSACENPRASVSMIKIENEDLCEMIEIDSDYHLNAGKTADAPAHHSSQCGTCPHCGKDFSNQSALKYHVRLMHSDLTNMFCCHLCPESFDYREGYKKHMADVHFMRN